MDEARERQHLIDRIKGYWPADDPDPSTRAIGQELLEEAKANVMGWRMEPLEVLREYHRLCVDRDYQNANRVLRRP